MGWMHGCGQGGMGCRRGQRRGTCQPRHCCTAAATCTTSYLLCCPCPCTRQLATDATTQPEVLRHQPTWFCARFLADSGIMNSLAWPSLRGVRKFAGQHCNQGTLTIRNSNLNEPWCLLASCALSWWVTWQVSKR